MRIMTNERTQLTVIGTDSVKMTPQQQKRQNALIAAELFRLRIAYPTQARNFSASEVAATNALWQEIFAEVEPAILHEAVMRFIVADRKGFFPSPGQIVGLVEEVLRKHSMAEIEQRMLERRKAALG